MVQSDRPQTEEAARHLCECRTILQRRWIRNALGREDVPHPCWHAERLYPITISFKVHQVLISIFFSNVPARLNLSLSPAMNSEASLAASPIARPFPRILGILVPIQLIEDIAVNILECQQLFCPAFFVYVARRRSGCRFRAQETPAMDRSPIGTNLSKHTTWLFLGALAYNFRMRFFLPRSLDPEIPSRSSCVGD